MPKMPMFNGPDGGLPPIPAADPGVWAEEYPTLAGWLTDLTWDDGKTRQPARLMIDLDGNAWRLTLKEPNLCLQVSVTTTTPEQLLSAMELLLRSKTVPWVVDKWAQERATKKRK